MRLFDHPGRLFAKNTPAATQLPVATEHDERRSLLPFHHRHTAEAAAAAPAPERTWLPASFVRRFNAPHAATVHLLPPALRATAGRTQHPHISSFAPTSNDSLRGDTITAGVQYALGAFWLAGAIDALAAPGPTLFNPHAITNRQVGLICVLGALTDFTFGGAVVGNWYAHGLLKACKKANVAIKTHPYTADACGYLVALTAMAITTALALYVLAEDGRKLAQQQPDDAAYRNFVYCRAAIFVLPLLALSAVPSAAWYKGKLLGAAMTHAVDTMRGANGAH